MLWFGGDTFFRSKFSLNGIFVQRILQHINWQYSTPEHLSEMGQKEWEQKMFDGEFYNDLVVYWKKKRLTNKSLNVRVEATTKSYTLLMFFCFCRLIWWRFTINLVKTATISLLVCFMYVNSCRNFGVYIFLFLFIHHAWFLLFHEFLFFFGWIFVVGMSLEVVFPPIRLLWRETCISWECVCWYCFYIMRGCCFLIEQKGMVHDFRFALTSLE